MKSIVNIKPKRGFSPSVPGVAGPLKMAGRKENKYMYIFEAHYINMDNNKEETRTIKFDGQFFENEKECYLYAMSKAYDMIRKNECFSSLDFVAC